MNKLKKTGNLNGFGIGVVVVLAIVMMIRYYTILVNEPIHMRLLYGAIACVSAFFGSGLFLLAMFIIVYFSSKAYDVMFIKNEEGEEPIEIFQKLIDVLSVAFFAVSYVIVFFGVKL